MWIDLGACVLQLQFCLSLSPRSSPHNPSTWRFTQVSGSQPREVLCAQLCFTDFTCYHHLGPALSLYLRLVDGATTSHIWSVILKTAGACLLHPPTAVFQSCLCFHGGSKDRFLGLVKSKEASLSPLLLGRYSLLESSSVSFRKHWGLNAIYSWCRRSQMLIFLWPIPEAFVLTEEVNAASDNWRSPPVVWLVHLTSQGGDRRQRGHGGSATVDSVASAFLLKLDPEARSGTEVPSGQLSLKCLHCKNRAFSRLRETWRTAESVLWVIRNDFYDSIIALISLMEKLCFGFTVSGVSVVGWDFLFLFL